VKVLDTFSGIGGISLGFEMSGCGYETVGFCEIEPYPRRILTRHWPGIWIHDDLRTLTGELVRQRCGSIDVITGGFPCQDISTAGKAAGIGTQQEPTGRSGLFWQLLRLVREVRPRWIFFENVSNLRTKGADAVLTAMEQEGYTCWPFVAGAWSVGARHKRDRVWIVGVRTEDLDNAERAGRTISPGEVTTEQNSNGTQDRLLVTSGVDGLAANTTSIGIQRLRPQRISVTEALVEETLSGRRNQRTGTDSINWSIEPNVGRVANGVSNRVDRIKSLGNAVVPQCVVPFARMIKHVDTVLFSDR
jgi:DNA (cytosine-5)-methyltransferase 1